MINVKNLYEKYIYTDSIMYLHYCGKQYFIKNVNIVHKITTYVNFRYLRHLFLKSNVVLVNAKIMFTNAYVQTRIKKNVQSMNFSKEFARNI